MDSKGAMHQWLALAEKKCGITDQDNALVFEDVPEEKYNVLDDLTGQVKDLEDKLNEQIEKNVNLSKDASELQREKLVVSVSEDLADTEKEKFTSMAENVEYDSKRIIPISQDWRRLSTWNGMPCGPLLAYALPRA